MKRHVCFAWGRQFGKQITQKMNCKRWICWSMIHTCLLHTFLPNLIHLCCWWLQHENVGHEHAQHLLHTLKNHYNVEKVWLGSLFCRISLQWDYNQFTLNNSMPNYINICLQNFDHKLPDKTTTYTIYTLYPEIWHSSKATFTKGQLPSHQQ